MAQITWSLTADLDRDGTFETDWTTYVANPGSGISVSRGITPDGMYKVSQVTFDLINDTGLFTPENSASAYYGLLRPGVPVRITCTHNGSSFTIWTGYAQRWNVEWASGRVPVCRVQAWDIADYLPTSEPVNVLVSTSRDSDGALVAICTALGIASTDYEFEDGAQDFPYHWCQAQPAMSAMMDAVRSEMGGLLWVDAFGKIVFEARTGRRGIGPLQRYIRHLGPAGYWRLGEATGTVAYDRGSAGVNGTYTGSPTLGVASLQANGDPDTCVTFAPGSSQYVSIADNAAWSLTTTNALSIHALINMTANDTGTNQGIVNKGSFATPNIEWSLYLQQSNGKIAFIVWEPTAPFTQLVALDSGVALTPGQTYQVVVTVDWSGLSATMYLNGTAVSTNPITNSGLYANGAGILAIGDVTGLNTYWNGQIDEVAVWPIALSATQVANLYRKHVQSAWGDSSQIVPVGLKYGFDELDYISTARVRTQILQTGQANKELYRFIRGQGYGDSRALTAGETWQFEASFGAVAIALTTLVAYTDYTANAAAAGTGTDMTSSLTVTVTDLGAGRVRYKLVNGHATDTLYITYLRQRGQPAQWSSDKPEYVFTKAGYSGDKAGRDISADLNWAGDLAFKPRDYAYHLLRILRVPYPTLTLQFLVGHGSSAANDSAIKDAILGLELGDLIYYKDQSMFSTTSPVQSAYVKDWYYVEGIDTAVRADDAGQVFSATITLVPSYIYRQLDRICYDTFDRSNVSGDLGTSFSNDVWAGDGNMDINSNKARANSDTAQVPNLDLGTLAFDGVAEVSLAAIGSGDEVGLIYRYVDANNYYRAYVDKGSNEVILEKLVGGVVTELSSPALTVGSAHELRVIWQANRHRVWVDSKLYIDTTDAALNTGTKAGLFARNANSTTTFEDFYSEGL